MARQTKAAAASAAAAALAAAAAAEKRAAFNDAVAKTLSIDGKTFSLSNADLALFAAVCTAVDQTSNIKAALYNVVSDLFGTTMPSYDVYTKAQQNLRAQAENGKRNVEHCRACFAGAVMSLYKGLPESTSEAALEKRAQRALKKRQAQQAMIDTGLAKAPKDWTTVDLPVKTTRGPGAPAGQTQQHPTNAKETAEQAIARIGMFEILDALTRLVAAGENGKLSALTLAAVSDQLRREMEPRKAK